MHTRTHAVHANTNPLKWLATSIQNFHSLTLARSFSAVYLSSTEMFSKSKFRFISSKQFSQKSEMILQMWLENIYFKVLWMENINLTETAWLLCPCNIFEVFNVFSLHRHFQCVGQKKVLWISNNFSCKNGNKFLGGLGGMNTANMTFDEISWFSFTLIITNSSPPFFWPAATVKRS